MKAVCAAIGGPGHAFPMLAVARALAGRGHDVTVATGLQHREEAARAGCAFAELPRTPGSPRDDLRPYDDALRQAEAFVPVLAALDPDVVVTDVITFGPALGADLLGIPWATLVIHALHLPSGEVPPFGWGFPPRRGPLALRDAWMRRGNRRDWARARAEIDRARARIGLPASDRPDPQVSGDLILVATLPSLEIARADWPARAHVVGPCLWDAGGEAVEPPPGDGPLVLVAPSTAHDQGATVSAALDAVSALGARAVVTGAGAAGPGLVASPFASHDILLPLCDAVVCSGGHGIVARTLTHGVPLVVVPGHGDQRENGYRVERAGAGLRVMRPRPRAVRAALARVLAEPAFREAAARLAAEAAAIDGPARAAGLVEVLAAREDASRGAR